MPSKGEHAKEATIVITFKLRTLGGIGEVSCEAVGSGIDERITPVQLNMMREQVSRYDAEKKYDLLIREMIYHVTEAFNSETFKM